MPTVEAVPAPAETARSRRWYSHPLNRGAAYRLARAFAGALPRTGRHMLAAALGRMACRCLRAEREHVRWNLQRVVPQADPRRLDATVTRVFRNFGCIFADLLTINRGPAEGLRHYLGGVRGEEHLAEAMAPARGVIVATAHLGNWELGGRLLVAARGRPTHVVLAAEEDPAVEAFLRRSTPGMRFVTLRHPTTSLALLAALRRNEIVAVQGDRATGGPSDVRLPFFRAPSAFPVGPFRLAAASGAPVLPVFCVLAEDARYRIYLEAPIWVERGGEVSGLERLVTVLERYLADFPDQWFAFYDVWESSREPA